jgi:alpha-tubulin suppressor-like RCC1 family protein
VNVHNRAALRTILIVLALASSACYRPSLGDCQVRCSGAAPGCPSGLTCDVAEGYCQADQAFDCSTVPRPDGGPPDGGPPPGTRTYSALSVGNAHACAIRASDTSMWCWGQGTDGALGNGELATSALPVYVGQDDGWFAVSAGNDYTCGLKNGDTTTGGDLFCWGLNNYGQVDADSRGTNQGAPLEVSQSKKWKAVSAGDSGTTCAIDSQDHLYCGGENDEGQTGTGAAAEFLPLTLVGGASPATWRMVAVSYHHVCGIQTSGELYCWGANNNVNGGTGDDGVLGTGDSMNHPTPARVGTATDWVTVSTSGVFNCGIRGTASGGNLYCWGRDSGNLGRIGAGGAPVETPRLVGNALADNDWKAIASEGRHSCGIRAAGGHDQLFCFGLGQEGALGLGTRADHPAPIVVDAASSWLAIGAGEASHCGLRADGAVLCWGIDDDGQLGDGHRSVEPEPVRIGDQVGWGPIALGEHHTCGLRGAELYCWGMNEWGQLGLGAGEITEHPTPQRVAGNWNAVAAGNYHSCAIDENLGLYCWGNNYDGALGTGDSTGNDAPHSVPKKVAGSGVPIDWLSVDGGLTHTCAIAGERSLWCWGANYAGQLGRGLVTDGSNRPVRVGTQTEWSSVACGTAFSCAVHAEPSAPASIWCFGENNHDQLGHDGPDTGTPTQVAVTGTPSFGDLVATGEHTCGIVGPDDDLRCWGGNGTGTLGLGDGMLADSFTPAPAHRPGPWLSVAVGHVHTCAVSKTDGTLWCWGDGQWGQLGNGMATAGAIFDDPFQIGNDSDWSLVFGGWEDTCGIKTDGSLWCWGRNSRGQIGNGQDSTLVPARIADPS